MIAEPPRVSEVMEVTEERTGGSFPRAPAPVPHGPASATQEGNGCLVGEAH